MRSICLFLLVLVLLGLTPIRTDAQAATVTFSQSNVTSTAQAQGFTYRLSVTPAGGTTTNAPVVLTGVTCSGSAPTVTCSSTLPAAASAATVTGAKTTMTAAVSATAVESAPSLPFTPGASAPAGLSIQ
jgi:hypothetical protein